MTKKEIIQSSIGILLLAMLAETIWLYEIVVRIGWTSLGWLEKDLFSPFAVCFCAATAYILPFLIKYKHIDGKVILTWLSFIFINITVFYMGDAVLKSLFSRFSMALSIADNLKMRLLGLLAVGIFSFGYYFVTNELIIKVCKQQVALFILIVFFMFVLCVVTVSVFDGFGHATGFTEAIKMGYPQFWVCVLLGVSGILTNMYFSEEE